MDDALDYSEMSWALEAAKDPALNAGLCRLITNGEPIDDYGIRGESVFASVSPKTAAVILDAHASYRGIPPQIPSGPTPADVLTYTEQWLNVLRWSKSQRLGVAFLMD